MKASFLTKETVMGYGIQDLKFPKFNVGDTICVAQKIKEGDKQRIQMYEGSVIAIHNNGIASTFTVRKISANAIGVEKIFPYHTPMIDNIKLIKRGVVRRAKLYYLRDRVGKATKIEEKLKTKKEKDSSKVITDVTQEKQSDSKPPVIDEQKNNEVENK